MKLWTMLVSLLLAAVVVSSVCAQEKEKDGKKGRGKGRTMMTFKEMVGSDDGKLTEELYVKARTKNAPEDKKEAAATRAKEGFKRLAGDKKELTKDEYEAAVKKMIENFKGRGGKRGGDKGEKKET
jgi:hypothetical protein